MRRYLIRDSWNARSRAFALRARTTNHREYRKAESYRAITTASLLRELERDRDRRDFRRAFNVWFLAKQSARREKVPSLIIPEKHAPRHSWNTLEGEETISTREAISARGSTKSHAWHACISQSRQMVAFRIQSIYAREMCERCRDRDKKQVDCTTDEERKEKATSARRESAEWRDREISFRYLGLSE